MKFVLVFLLAIALIEAESDPGNPNVVVTKHHHQHHHRHHHSHPAKKHHVTKPKPDANVPGPQEEPQPEYVPESVPGSEPYPEQQPELQPEPQSEQQTESQPEPQFEPQPEPQPQLEQESESDQEREQENPESEPETGPGEYSNPEQDNGFETTEPESEQWEQPDQSGIEQEKKPNDETETENESKSNPDVRPGTSINDENGPESEPRAEPARTVDNDNDDLIANWTKRLKEVEKEFEDRGESSEFAKRLHEAGRLFWRRLDTPSGSETESDVRSEMQCTSPSGTGRGTSLFGRIFSSLTNPFRAIRDIIKYILTTPLRVVHRLEGYGTNFINRLSRYLGIGSESKPDTETEPQQGSGNGSFIGNIFARWAKLFQPVAKTLANGLRRLWRRFENKLRIPVELAERIRKYLGNLENRLLGFIGLNPEPESEQSSGRNQENEPGQEMNSGQGTEPGQDSKEGQNTGIDIRSLPIRSFLRGILSRWSRLYHRIINHFHHIVDGLIGRIESVEKKISNRLGQVRERITGRFEFPAAVAERVEKQLRSVENGVLSNLGLEPEPESEQRSGPNQEEESGHETNSGQGTKPGQETEAVQRSLSGNSFISFIRSTLSRWSRIYHRIIDHFQHKFDGLSKRFETIVERFRDGYDSHKGLASNLGGFWTIFKLEFQSVLPSGLASRLELVEEKLEHQLRWIEEIYKRKLQFPRDLTGRFETNLKNFEERLLGFIGLEPEQDEHALSSGNSDGSIFQRILSRWSRIYHRIVELVRNEFNGWFNKYGNIVKQFRTRFHLQRGLIYNWRIFLDILENEIQFPSGLLHRFQGFMQNFRKSFNSQGGLAEGMTGFGNYLETKLNIPREWANTLGGYIVDLRNDISGFLDSNDQVGEFRKIIGRRWAAIQNWPNYFSGAMKRLRKQISSRTGLVDKLEGFVEYLQNEVHLPTEWARNLLEHLGNLENGVKNFFAPGGEINDLRNLFNREWSIFLDKVQEAIGVLIIVNGKSREIADTFGLEGNILHFWGDLIKSYFRTIAGVFEFWIGTVNTVIGEIGAVIEDVFTIIRSEFNLIKAIPNKKVSHLASIVAIRKHNSTVH